MYLQEQQQAGRMVHQAVKEETDLPDIECALTFSRNVIKIIQKFRMAVDTAVARRLP